MVLDKIQTPAPLTHQLPEWIMWAVTLLTATAMAFINLGEVMSIEYLVLWKFGAMQWMIGEVGLVVGVTVLVGICMGFALLGVCLIECTPEKKHCSGSGLPENKCYLSGSPMEGFFTIRTLFIRISTSILANAAGFPVGREGPTVVIGSNVAYLISHLIVRKRLGRWVRGGSDTKMHIVDEERVAHATRIACAVGGACGMAMVFNVPIGGLLYMLEEITSVSWPLELTFRAFVATALCAFLSKGLMNLNGTDIQDFVIYSEEPRNDVFGWRDVPWFILLAAFVGLVTSLHTRGMLFIARCRKRWCSTRPSARIVETVLFSAFCVSVSAVASLAGACKKGYPGINSHVQFNCKDGYFNEIASLLVNTSHSAVKLLFSCEKDMEFGPDDCAIAFVVYCALNVGLSGLPVPGGAFTGTMLLGGLMGRCAGGLLYRHGHEYDFAHPGIYSVAGCAAMLCGFKQMTATVVIICIQCVNNVKVAPVVMLSVSVAMWVNKCVNNFGHDERQIQSKKLPFLEPEVPQQLEFLLARDLCDPCTVKLQSTTSLDYVSIALASNDLYFPVFSNDETECVGIVARKHLEALRDGRDKVVPGDSPSCSGLIAPGGSASSAVPIDGLMDATPFTIMEDMRAARFYKLFSKEGEKVACCVSRNGDFRGIISREGLIGACYE
jgi:chloride channel 7